MNDAAADMSELKPDDPPANARPATAGPIVPADSIAGRALITVVAIMGFLACLTIGAVVLIGAAASEWQSDVSREVTIQIRPVEGRDVEVEVAKAVEIARAAPGIAEARPYSKAESARLLEPWLGGGLSLDELPVPRMIVVKLAPGAKANLDPLRKTLAERVVGASLDDHRGWIDRMRTMARTAVLAGFGVLVLVMIATVLTVSFATHGAMATNRPTIEVLHFIGAKDSFIARQFQGHFLVLGLKGGAVGGGIAIFLFLIARGITNWFKGTAGEEQVAALFGTFSLGLAGYAAVIAQIIVIALITAATARFTVNRTLRSIS